MLPKENLKLRSSELLETCILLVIFASSESSREVTKLREKGTFSEILQVGGMCPLCSPIPTSMALTTGIACHKFGVTQ